MGTASKIATGVVVTMLVTSTAHARGGYTHHSVFDSEHANTSDFLARPCAKFTDACRSLVSTTISSNYWGCAPIQAQGVDEAMASKAVYDWLRVNKTNSRSPWSTDAVTAFHTVYPSCHDAQR